MIYLFFFSLSLIAAGSSLTAEPPPARHEHPVGVGNYGVETIDSMRGDGLIKLQGTNVADLNINGSLLSKDAIVGTLTIQGEANLRDTTISGNAAIIGSLRTHGSIFEKPITLYSQKAVFTKTDIHSLTIRQEKSYKGKQIIELKQGSIVKGPIHFESGKGEVHIDATSRVEGKVTGGKICRK